MPTRPDAFPQIALKRAHSPDVARLFQELARRAEIFAQMQDEFTRSIMCHREAREGRPVHLSRAHQRTLENFDRDAGEATRDMERHASIMDDAALLTCALSGIDRQIQLDESLMSGWHKDDQPMAQQLLDFQHETKRLIQKFVETSPFRSLVRSIN